MTYNDGKKTEQGKLESEGVSMEQLKQTYGSLTKKAASAYQAMQLSQKQDDGESTTKKNADLTDLKSVK